jgi:hypothetical protein
MRQAGKAPQNEIVDIVIGEVTSVYPLRVKIENRELTESFLIVGALCQEKRISGYAFTIPEHTHEMGNEITEPSKSTPTDVLLWRGLWVGDKVLMLKVGRGQKYYILQREEGVT